MPIQTAIAGIAPVYGWNILAAAGMAFQVVLIGGMVGAARRKYKVDYPDMGSGRFTQKLTDDQWVDFNNHQRAHQNYVEGISTAIALQLLGGLYYPKAAAWLGLLYIVGRQVYALGYTRSGAKGRLAGALLFDVALVGKLGMVIWGSLQFLGYF